MMDPRHATPEFLEGYGLAMYWETLARWMSLRARRDARDLKVPLVFLQAVDECNTIKADVAKRLLNVPNTHTTGHIHGVLPVHEGMEVASLCFSVFVCLWLSLCLCVRVCCSAWAPVAMWSACK